MAPVVTRHPKMVARLADIYMERYKTLGFKSAAEYATAFISQDKEMQKLVKDEIQLRFKKGKR